MFAAEGSRVGLSDGVGRRSHPAEHLPATRGTADRCEHDHIDAGVDDRYAEHYRPDSHVTGPRTKTRPPARDMLQHLEQTFEGQRQPRTLFGPYRVRVLGLRKCIAQERALDSAQLVSLLRAVLWC